MGKLGFQPLGHGLQNGIAKMRIQHAVDVGKPVQIQQGQHPLRVFLRIQGRHHGIAVGQADQVIDKGQFVDVQVQLQILERYRDIAGKHFQQPLLQRLQRAGQIDPHRQGHGMRTRDEQLDAVVKTVVLHLQGLLQLPHAPLQAQAVQRLPGPVLPGGRGGQHARLGPLLLQGDGDAAGVRPAILPRRAGHLACQQGIQLDQQVLRKPLQGGGLAQRQGGIQNPRQPLVAGFKLLDLRIGPDGDGQAGEQPHLGQLRFGAVIVDVVLLNRLQFRGIARLAGAQHDAQGAVGQLVTHIPHQPQAGILRFHHHVDQGHGKVIGPLQQDLRLPDRMRVAERQGAPFDLQPLERQPGGGVDVRLVIDHQNVPGSQRQGVDAAIRLVYEYKVFMGCAIGHGTAFFRTSGNH